MSKQLGVVLVNLGTPEEPTAKSVRKFLAEFLSDQRVVELPSLLWKIILFGVILPFRPKKVAQAYKSIWTEGGSPLKVILEAQAKLLQDSLLQGHANKAPKVRYAMTYGAPSIECAVDELLDDGAERVLLLPLYPQYSATTTGAVYDQMSDLIKRRRNIPHLFLHKQYCERDDYIEALTDSIHVYREKNGESQILLFSFHGIPKRCVDLGDPYYQQCLSTAEKTAAKLNLDKSQWAISFQSRLGKAEWLKPYTSELLTEWGGSGVESVDVVCPAFSADCLETLEEIKIENRDVFMEAGGKNYQMIPCLNTSEKHIQMMAKIVEDYEAIG